jgi:DNA-binding CsgD family transcriptional regulator
VESEALESGREAYARQAWLVAYEALRRAALQPDDLVRLATSAYMLGRDEEFVDVQRRAYHGFREAGEDRLAARCAIWAGIVLMLRREIGPATAWLGRASRLVDVDCAERGYLLLPVSFERAAHGAPDAAADAAAGAAALGERFADPDLVALAAQQEGLMLIAAGRVIDGLGRLDDAMLALTDGDLSPMVCGFVYCGVILGCQSAYEPGRAQQWTDALTRWCEQQPDLVSFTGNCRVHRAELMQLHGAWEDALGEARLAAAQDAATARALYRQGELHRLRGDVAAAETAYLDAGRRGVEPQPGLALLRLAQGRTGAAGAAIRRVLAETTEPSARAGLLPASVEILVAGGDLEAARDASDELARIAESWASAMLDAMVAQARGTVELAAGDPAAALVALREACQAWRGLGAPYEVARTRVLIGRACAALGDADGAALELEAARDGFARLGAAPDLTGLEPGAPEHGLTARELQVLRLIATGRSNRQIATELVISERTVARHVQNIFAKLRVSSRTAASAFAYENELVRHGQK